MARHRKGPGAREDFWVDLNTPGFLIPAPDAPWIECLIVDVCEGGASLDVGALAVPKIFGLSFTSGGEVRRVCSLIWRRGERVGARFMTAKQLRQASLPKEQRDPKRQKAAAS
jgi:hypothetical protein